MDDKKMPRSELTEWALQKNKQNSLIVYEGNQKSEQNDYNMKQLEE
jgi:hypothetical protein